MLAVLVVAGVLVYGFFGGITAYVVAAISKRRRIDEMAMAALFWPAVLAFLVGFAFAHQFLDERVDA